MTALLGAGTSLVLPHEPQRIYSFGEDVGRVVTIAGTGPILYMRVTDADNFNRGDVIEPSQHWKPRLIVTDVDVSKHRVYYRKVAGDPDQECPREFRHGARAFHEYRKSLSENRIGAWFEEYRAQLHANRTTA